MPATTREQKLVDTVFRESGLHHLLGGTSLQDLAWQSTVPDDCPDPTPDKFDFRGRLWLGQFNQHGRLQSRKTVEVHSRRELEQLLRSDQIARPMREASIDWFSYGDYQDVAPWSQSGPTGTYVPLIPGPQTRQQYWSEYFATSAKTFEAYHHDPLAHRGTEIGVEFTLGRGVECRVKGDKGQRVWDAWWQFNRMDQRLEEWARTLGLYGELITRWFPAPAGATHNLGGTQVPVELVVRELDPATIYEIVTDQEDRETVFFYHQQYPTRTELYSPRRGDSGAPTGPSPQSNTKFVVRQIDAAEIDHVRINAVAAEVRGRPDLFPALGFMKQLRDLLIARIIRADMQARMVYDLTVKGSGGDVTAVRNALFPNGKPPDPGSVFGHNDMTSLQGLNFQQGSDSAVSDDYQMLVSMIAAGIGVSREYLINFGHQGARANALVATEPGAKRFENRQKLLERILRQAFDRVARQAGLSGDDANVEFIFPSIASEDRSAKLKDLAFAEGMGWISKRTAATIAGREMDFSSYDFGEEQDEIAAEFNQATGSDGPDGKPARGDGVIRRPMLLSQFRQEPKLDPTRAGGVEDQPPGVLVPTDGTSPASPGQLPGRAGMPAADNPLGSEGRAQIKRENQGVLAGARESRVELTVGELSRLIREARREPRRRPDDPAFVAASREYRDRARAGLDQLARDVQPIASERGPDA